MTTIEAEQYLDSFINYETVATPYQYTPSFKLERVAKLLSLLGNPQDSFKSLHVAGTKGKGSACAFAAFILRAAGYRVGLYTSPHLSDYKERIRVLDPLDAGKGTEDVFSGKISEEEFCRLVDDIKPEIEAVKKDESLGPLTFFEIYTVLALCYFKKQNVDFAVLETGLGGRLDATNVVHSLVCAIMPISLEHTKLLGSTVAEIAKEKAAIIKDRNQIAVIAPQPSEAMEVIEAQCRRAGAKAVFINKDTGYRLVRQDFREQIFDVHGVSASYLSLKTTLIGEHQAVNASVAIAMTEALCGLGFTVHEKAVAQGISEARWPGRFEVIGENPFIILDSAHNPGSSRVLADTLRAVFPGKKAVVVLGVFKDKDKENICRELNGIAGSVVFTRADHLRAFDFTEDFSGKFFKGKKCVFTVNTRDALKAALAEAKKDDVIVVTGSIFLVGEARELCKTHI